MILVELNGSPSKILRTLTDADAHAIRDAILAINEFRRDRQAFQITQLNFDELEAYDNHIGALFKGATDIEGMFLDHETIRIQLNRLVSNYLSSVRSFRDQTLHILSGRLGERGKDAFEKATNHEFDSSFDYRFIEQLRNFTQHFGYGMDSVGLSFLFGLDGTVIGELSLDFDRDGLLASGFQWKASVRDEMRNGPAKLDVLACLRRYNASVIRLNSVREALVSSSARTGAKVLAEIEREANCFSAGHLGLADEKDSRNCWPFPKSDVIIELQSL